MEERERDDIRYSDYVLDPFIYTTGTLYYLALILIFRYTDLVICFER